MIKEKHKNFNNFMTYKLRFKIFLKFNIEYKANKYILQTLVLIKFSQDFYV